MAYVSGTAASFQDLKTAAENAAVSAGWSLNSGVLSKGSAFVKFVANPSTASTPALSQLERFKLILYAGTGQSADVITGGDPLDGACMGSPQEAAVGKIKFPVNYEVYTFNNPDEVHLVINYNSDFYQFIAFGISDIPGIGGTGLWTTGSFGRSIDMGAVSSANQDKCYIQAAAGTFRTDPYGGPCLPYFVAGRESSGGASNMCGVIHTGLDSTGWKSVRNSGNTSSAYGAATIAGLLVSLPSPFNQAAVLLPARIVQWRNSNGSTIVANIRTARFTRNDNIRPGEVVSYGSDRWKVYPLYRKDTVNRNGVGWATGAIGSGTFAIALKYEGP